MHSHFNTSSTTRNDVVGEIRPAANGDTPPSSQRHDTSCNKWTAGYVNKNSGAPNAPVATPAEQLHLVSRHRLPAGVIAFLGDLARLGVRVSIVRVDQPPAGGDSPVMAG